MRYCGRCGAQIPDGNIYCGRCGIPIPLPAPEALPVAPQPRPRRQGRTLLVAVVVLVALIALAPTLTSLGHSGAQQASRSGTFGDGTYRVGIDIAPGLYHTDGGSGCYWARLRSTSDTSASAIIANDNAAGPVTVLIKDTDVAFQAMHCGQWSRGHAPASAPATTFGDGTYLVGTDIKAGTYRTAGGDGCYWARSADAGGAASSLIANDNASGPAIVTIAPTDGAFESRGCGTWHHIPDPVPGGTAGVRRFGDGTYRVGVDIAPGYYNADVQDGCYYALLRGFGGTPDDIIDNANPLPSEISTEVDSQTPDVVGFESKGCGTWTVTNG